VIAYPFSGEKSQSPAGTQSAAKPDLLAKEIAEFLSEPNHFYDVLRRFETEPYRAVVQAWALLREAGRLGRETTTGRYVIKN